MRLRILIFMEKMRKILQELMSASGDNAHTLAEKSKVTQPTIHRFLAGNHQDPRSATVSKLAKAYGITESQLRGDSQISLIKTDPKEFAEILNDLRIMTQHDVLYVSDLCNRLAEERTTKVEKKSGRKTG